VSWKADKPKNLHRSDNKYLRNDLKMTGLYTGLISLTRIHGMINLELIQLIQFSCDELIKYHSMKTYGGVEVEIHHS
jgi:hypothetical protein